MCVKIFCQFSFCTSKKKNPIKCGPRAHNTNVINVWNVTENWPTTLTVLFVFERTFIWTHSTNANWNDWCADTRKIGSQQNAREKKIKVSVELAGPQMKYDECQSLALFSAQVDFSVRWIIQISLWIKFQHKFIAWACMKIKPSRHTHAHHQHCSILFFHHKKHFTLSFYQKQQFFRLPFFFAPS